MAKGSEEIIDAIVSVSGLSRQEIAKKIKEKKGKFSGLLEDRSAAYMIARELGIEVDEASISNAVKISELKDGMRGIDVVARAKHIFPLKEFERQGKKGVLRNLLVSDETGEARLTLWHDDAKKIDALKAERGDVLLLSNCYVTTWQEKPQLNLAYGGQFSVDRKGSHPELPAAEIAAVKLSGLRADMSNVDVYGRVTRAYEKREFERQGKQGAVLNFEIGDETSSVRAAAWNEHADEMPALKGSVVKIEGAYTKEGLKGVELNLGWQARVLQDPEGVKIESIAEGAGGAPETLAVKIPEISSEGLFEISGMIGEIFPGNLRYFVCGKCGKKVETAGTDAVCARCGEVKAEPRLYIGFSLEEGGSDIRCVAFGDEAEKILGMKTKAVMKKLVESPPEGIVEAVKEKNSGKEFRVRGRVRQNDMSGLFEMIANSVEAVSG